MPCTRENGYSLKATLEYDFNQEKAFSYAGLSLPDAIRHLTGFISGIWQIHPFGEGNARTTAVFAIKYFRALGFDAKNDLFAQHSWYFRNALVRANYTNLNTGVHADPVYLERFFENLLLGVDHPLKNRSLHIDYQKASGTMEIPKCQFDTLDCTLEELTLLQAVQQHPDMTQQELAKKIGRSLRTVKRMTVRLQEQGILSRENGKRNGRWVVKGNLT